MHFFRTRYAAALLFVCLLAGCGEVRPLNAYERGAAALASGEYDAAMDYFAQGTADADLESLSYRGQGLIYLDRGDYPSAISAFTESLNTVRAPRLNKSFVVDTTLYLADAYMHNGQSDKALTAYSQLLDSDRSGEAYLLRGKIYAEDGKFGQAGQDFQRAVERDPSYEIYLQIYDIYAGLNRQADGARYLKEAREGSSDTPEDAFQLGRICYLLGDYDGARTNLTQAMNGGVAGAASLLGRVYLDSGDVSGARTIFQSCIDRGEEQAAGHNGMALCHIETGDYQMALQQIHEGLSGAGKDEAEQLLFNEIVIYERQFDFQTAFDKMESFLATYPGNREAQKEHLFLKSRIAQTESVPEDISGDVWAHIIRGWEEAAAQTEETQNDTEPVDTTETYAYDDIEDDDSEEESG